MEGHPHAHLVVEDHALAVLAAAVDDRVHVRVVAFRPGDVRGDFADLEIVRDEAFRVLDDLAARHDRAGDVPGMDAGVKRSLRDFGGRLACDVSGVQPCLGKECGEGLFQRAHVAAAAGRAAARAGKLTGIHRLRALVSRMDHAPLVCDDDGFECRGSDIDPEVVFHRWHPESNCGWIKKYLYNIPRFCLFSNQKRKIKDNSAPTRMQKKSPCAVPRCRDCEYKSDRSNKTCCVRGCVLYQQCLQCARAEPGTVAVEGLPSPQWRSRSQASTNWSRSPSSTAAVLPVSTPVRRSFTIWYG